MVYMIDGEEDNKRIESERQWRKMLRDSLK